MLSQRGAARGAAAVVVNSAWAVDLTPRTVGLASRRIQQDTLHELRGSTHCLRSLTQRIRRTEIFEHLVIIDKWAKSR